LPVRIRPRWKDQHRAHAPPQGVPSRRDRGRPSGTVYQPGGVSPGTAAVMYGAGPGMIEFTGREVTCLRDVACSIGHEHLGLAPTAAERMTDSHHFLFINPVRSVLDAAAETWR
jgi:hypothetical protein